MLLKACCSSEVARGSAGARCRPQWPMCEPFRKRGPQTGRYRVSHLWPAVSQHSALIPLSFEAIRKCVHTGPKPFGFSCGVAAQTVRFGLSKPRSAIFDKDFLGVSAWQRVKA